MDAESQASECTSHTHSALTVYIFLVGEVITSHKSILFKTTSNDIREKASQIVPERRVSDSTTSAETGRQKLFEKYC